MTIRQIRVHSGLIGLKQQAGVLPRAGRKSRHRAVKYDQAFTITLQTPETLISVTINGESRAFDRPPSCADLIGELRLAGKRIAMERNGEIVPRSQFDACVLQDGDRLEIVAAVGGG